MSKIERFLTRRDATAPGKPFNDEQPPANPASTDWQRRINDTRAKVPPTRLESKPEINVSSLKGLAEGLAARHPLRSDTDLGHQKSTFDDTDYAESTISSIDGVPQEQKYDMSTGYRQVSPKSARAYDVPQLALQNVVVEEDDQEDQVNPKIEGDDDDDYHRDLSGHDHLNFQTHLRFCDDELAEARRFAPENTRYLRGQVSSRPDLIHHPDHDAIRSKSPIPFRDPPTSRPRSAQALNSVTMAPPAIKPIKRSLTVATAPLNTSTHTNAFDKTSSYTDSSADKTPPLPPQRPREQNNKKKRPLSDEASRLDYDAATLKTLSFADLESQPFDLDPRHPNLPENSNSTPPRTPPPTSDPEKLLQTLRALSSSSSSSTSSAPSSEQLTHFFASQTQDQWLACTCALQKRLDELFVELKNAREGRREVARRFEREVKARMVEVGRSEEGIESALGGIRGRAGGLLRGRKGGMIDLDR